MVLDWDKVSSNQSSIFKQMCRPLKKYNDEEEEKDEEVQWCQSLHLDIAPKTVQRRRSLEEEEEVVCRKITSLPPGGQENCQLTVNYQKLYRSQVDTQNTNYKRWRKSVILENF